MFKYIIKNINCCQISDLEKQSSRFWLQYSSKFKNPLRRKQILLEGIILKQLFGTHVQLFHYPSGQPYVSLPEQIRPYFPQCHISISHSNEFLAIALGFSPVGIDMENLNRNFERIKHKFIARDELIPDMNKKFLALLWSSKEAVYKLWAKKGLSFKQNIKIIPPAKIFSYGQTKAFILINNKKINVNITYFLFKNQIFTIAKYDKHRKFPPQ